LRVHILQHVAFEGPGSITSWLERRAAEVSVTRLFADARFPATSELDWLIVLGGPMSVNDGATLPWLAPEQRFIADAIAASKSVLGICLGAQLVASALGARVQPNREKEIGWFPVEPTRAAADSAFASIFQLPLEVFHWHGETFTLPPGATQLLRSAACEQQGFALGERVLALQFHLETTPETARALIESCPADLAPARWVQSGDEMLRDAGRFRGINRAMDAVLERMAKGVV
jgi:GMP synthase-like glutamine amidotransferase